MSDNIIGGAATVAHQFVNDVNDGIRYRTARAARAAIPAGVDGTVYQCRAAVPASLNARTLRRVNGDNGATAVAIPLRADDGTFNRPVVADIALSRVLFGHRTARGADWIGSRPNTDEQRIASGARTTGAARDAFVSMLADTAHRLDVTTDALRAWMATDGAMANVPDADTLAALRAPVAPDAPDAPTA